MDWDKIPRLLQDLCDGHPGFSVELYALDYPNGVRSWLCKNCYGRTWDAAGRPAHAKWEWDKISAEPQTPPGQS